MHALMHMAKGTECEAARIKLLSLEKLVAIFSLKFSNPTANRKLWMAYLQFKYVVHQSTALLLQSKL